MVTPPPVAPEHQSAQSAPTAERAIAGVIGTAAGVAGVIAVFETTNELGTAALFIVAGAFLICATFGVVPTRVRVGNNEVNVGRAALHTLEQIVSESDLPTQERVIEALETNLARDGIERTPDDAVAAMLDRFVRYSGSDAARAFHDEMVARGWTPSTPKKSTYIRWNFAGAADQVSLFQNSGQIVIASSKLGKLVSSMPGATPRAKEELVFSYSDGIQHALDVAEVLRRFADR
ncbi:hypothetical protein [Nocardioides kribbensis]|uniref:Uncharacterized protein n=1 Tax=Nocardioides kribbensis TaxID=305517 RepID=A0ABV1P3D7_9ACTN